MKIEKVNNLWVPSNDIHIEQWKNGQPFTQNKCLNSFIEWCDSQHQTFRTVLDIGAWCGTWSIAIAKYSQRVHAFEPDKTHFTCLTRNVAPYVNVDPKMIALGDSNDMVSLSNDDFTQAKRIIENGNIQLQTIDDFNFDTLRKLVGENSSDDVCDVCICFTFVIFCFVCFACLFFCEISISSIDIFTFGFFLKFICDFLFFLYSRISSSNI